MAAVGLTITIETWPFNDAVDELVELQGRLASRHGEAFRQLDRDLEDLFEAAAMGALEADVAELADRTPIILPPPAVTEILRRARTLGVL